MRTAIFMAMLSATTAWADCSITLEKGDHLERNKDLVVNAGDHFRDAIVIDGNLTVKKGATVHNAFATGGTVIIEEGATVEGDVVVFDGHAKVSKGATVKGSQLIVGDSLKVTGEDGQKSSMKIEIDGKSLSSIVALAALKELRACKISN